MRIWMTSFLNEIDRIEAFYTHMQRLFKLDFEDLKKKLVKKMMDD